MEGEESAAKLEAGMARKQGCKQIWCILPGICYILKDKTDKSTYVNRN